MTCGGGGGVGETDGWSGETRQSLSAASVLIALLAPPSTQLPLHHHAPQQRHRGERVRETCEIISRFSRG